VSVPIASTWLLTREPKSSKCVLSHIGAAALFLGFGDTTRVRSSSGINMPVQASQSIFAVTELLENILLYVDESKTLFGAQLVSRTFNHTIKHSTRLRKLMFLSTEEISRPRDVALEYQTVIRYNPLLLAKLPMLGSFDYIFQKANQSSLDLCLVFMGDESTLAACNESARRTRNDAASWRRTYLLASACTEALTISIRARPQASLLPTLVRTLVFETNPTLGQLVDTIMETTLTHLCPPSDSKIAKAEAGPTRGAWLLLNDLLISTPFSPDTRLSTEPLS
jgi:hypothetical protein